MNEITSSTTATDPKLLEQQASLACYSPKLPNFFNDFNKPGQDQLRDCAYRGPQNNIEQLTNLVQQLVQMVTGLLSKLFEKTSAGTPNEVTAGAPGGAQAGQGTTQAPSTTTENPPATSAPAATNTPPAQEANNKAGNAAAEQKKPTYADYTNAMKTAKEYLKNVASEYREAKKALKELLNKAFIASLSKAKTTKA